MSNLSRRDFLIGAGGLAAGATMGSMLGIVTPKTSAAPRALPWPYVQLDPEEALRRGYDMTASTGSWMYGGFNAIISQLAEKIGEPFSSFPAEATWYGMGGVTTWGTICGALNGVAFAANLLVPQEDVVAVCNAVIEWHNRSELPTTDLDSYVGSKTIVQNVADSPLCHISRSKFEAQNPTAEEITHRCRKLTGDVARKMVLVLNDYHKGTFVDKFVVSAEVEECKTCHPGPESYGIMDCTPCHDDHTK